VDPDAAEIARPPEPQPLRERPRSGAVGSIVAGGVIIAGVYFGRVILEPFALAVLLSLMLAPAVRELRRLRIGRVASVLVTVLFAFIAIFGFVSAVGDEMISLAQNLPKYEENIATKIRSLNGIPGSGIVSRATQVFRDLGEEIAGPPNRPFGGTAGEPRPLPVEIHGPQTTPILVLSDLVGPLLRPLATAGLVVLFVVLILLQREDLRGRLLRLAGAGDLHRATAAMNEAAERLSRYLLMQLAAGLAFGIPVGIGLAVIGIPNAALWGMVGLLMRFVPFIGGPLTAVVPLALAIAVDPGWSLVLWTALLFTAAEFAVGNIVEPWLYTRSTGLSSVAVIAATSVWTWLWGPVGLLLATPLTVCLVVLGRYVPQLQFLDVLLGNQPVLSPQESLYHRLLARDPEEATEQAEQFIKDSSVEGFFDEVVVPALAMAQADSDRGVLYGDRRAVIAEGLAALLDNIAEDGWSDRDWEGAGAREDPIVCIAGRNELDLAAAWLLRYLLRRHGRDVVVYSPDAASTFNLDRLPLKGAPVVCLSLVSTNSAARARYLVRRIRRQARHARLIVAFWGQNFDAPEIADAVVATAADAVVTNLREAIADIEAALPSTRQEPELTKRSA
jgi:predicted PurR-regulated permease PerM